MHLDGRCRTLGLASSMTRYRYSPEELAAAVAQSVSIAGVMRILGIKPAGGSHFYLSTRIKRSGLDTSHFTGKGHNAGRELPRQPAEYFLKRFPAGSNRVGAKYLRRALLESGVPYQCALCDVADQWQGDRLVLHIDHRDGDSLNCERDNLRFLCPNCHSQTPTYCRRRSTQ